MTIARVEFERSYDLPRTIVWEALLDPDLLAGWLAEARVDPRVGGRFDLSWQTRHGLADTEGVIARLDFPVRLDIDTSNIGRLEFSLEELPDGTRGTATRLHVSIDAATEPRFLATTRAYWRCNLDQLEELLRGHPVDWENWERDRGPVWSGYLAEESA